MYKQIGIITLLALISSDKLAYKFQILFILSHNMLCINTCFSEGKQCIAGIGPKM